MPAKKKSEVSPLPPPAPTASPRTTRSRKRALDEVLEQSDETVATELTVLDTAAPSQPATAVRALPVRFASRRQGEQPATKAAPPKKRSREAVLQEKLARIEAEQAALNQRRAEYAQWELDQDAIMEEDAENAVTSLSDIEGEGKDVEMEDADDKEYASGQGDESSEAEVTKETSKAPVKRKKPLRGESRRNMDTVTARLAANASKKKLTKDTEKQEPAKKKQKKSTAATGGTGLKSNWQQHLTNKGSREGDSSDEGSVMGGLNDDDTNDDPPEVASRRDARANKLVKVTPPTRPTTDVTTKPKNKKPSVSNSESKTPAPELKPKVKREITTSLTPTTPTSSSVVDLSRDEDDVPDDIATSAKRVYGHVLQTVYRLMGESLMPFSDFIAGPEFDKQVRRAVDLVLTDKAASVRKQFAEHWKKQLLHRCTEKRSKLAAKTAKAVDALFSTSEYKDDPLKVRNYARYATRAGGPMLWKTPVPQLGTQTAPKDWKTYKAPDGIFESELIVTTMKDFLRSIPKAVPAKDSMPGLLALVMIGLTRGFQAYHKDGTKGTRDDFSIEQYGVAIDQCVGQAVQPSPRRWKHLMEIYGQVSVEDARVDDDDDVMFFSGKNLVLYVPSSP